MPEVRIRVGAAADQSLSTVFKPFVAAAIEARRQVQREFGIVPKAIGGAARQGTTEAKAALKEQEKAATAAARAQTKAAREAARENAALARQATREMQKEWLQQERAHRLAQRAMERSEQDRHRAVQSLDRQRSRSLEGEIKKQQREIEKFANRTSHRATRFFMPNAPIASMGRRAGSELMRGLGVDTTLSGGISRGVALQQEAIKLSNSAYQARNKGPAGTRVDPKLIEAFAREQANAAGMDPGAVLEGLRAFVGSTGDYATAKASAPGLLKLAKATGANPEDVLKTAGVTAATAYNNELAASFQEAGERAKFLFDVMNVGAGGGKLGTVEFEHLAGQGPKLAAAAQAFSGDKAQNLAEMMALAQLGLSGGAASPTQAATSVAAMVNTLRTPARQEKFEKYGVKLEDGSGRFRKASDIITESIVAAGTDTKAFKRMWMNVQGARSVEGLRQLYLEKGGGEAGEAAVRAKFKEFGADAALSPKEINDSFATAMDSTATKAQVFQNNLDKIVTTTAERLIPALEKAAPAFLKIAESLGDLAKWILENPKKAIAAAFGLAITRALAETYVRSLIERAIIGGAARIGVGTGSSALGGAGTSGGALANKLGAGALAGTAALLSLGLFAEEANQLQKATGAKSSLADVLPGMKGGSFSFSNLGDDVFNNLALMNPVSTAPIGERLEKSQLGRTGRAVKDTWQATGLWGDMAPNVQAWKDAALKKVEEEKAKRAAESTVTTKTWIGKPGEKADALLTRAKSEAAQEVQRQREQAALLGKVFDASLSKELKVRVINPEDIGAEPPNGDGPQVRGREGPDA